jgi:hypothetical protein
MSELLDVVGDAVGLTGFPWLTYRGRVTDIDDGSTAFVIIPHEYFALTGDIPPESRRRTIGFCVEHPGSETYEASFAAAMQLGARFDISEESRGEMRRRGVACERFELGYCARWDRRAAAGSRDIDVLYMGTADPRRTSMLAKIGPQIVDLHTDLLVPPHEPMTRPRPDFQLAGQKWLTMARSKVLLNLHRDSTRAFEWVRALEAICNGAVIVTEPSVDMSPLVPGVDLVVAEPARIASTVRAAVIDSDLRDRLSASALHKSQTAIRMSQSAERLVNAALALPSECEGHVTTHVRATTPPGEIEAAPVEKREPPLAVWVPSVRTLPSISLATSSESRLICMLLDRIDALAPAGELTIRAQVQAPPLLDVLCVSSPGDGPLGLTLDGLAESPGMSVHVALDGTQAPGVWRRRSVRSVLRYAFPVGRGRCRNRLLLATTAPLVLVLDSGDQLLPDALTRLLAQLEADADLDVAYCMASLGSGMLANSMVPEVRRLMQCSYLTRGYIARRTWLRRIDGFATSRALQDLADHDFWVRSAAAGVHSSLLRQVGAMLWEKRQQPGQWEREFGAVEQMAKRVDVAS